MREMMIVTIRPELSTRDAELIALALDEHATHSLGAPITRGDCARLRKQLLALVDREGVMQP